MRLSGQANVYKAVTYLGLAPAESEIEVLPIADWYRAGSETYIFRFLVVAEKVASSYVLKACVPFAAGITLSEVLQRWVWRRDYCSTIGIKTPALFAARFAEILEEDIPYELAGAFSLSDPHGRQAILDDLGETLAALSQARFDVISLADLRSHGNDVVMIDFGSDLGDPGQIRSAVQWEELIEMTGLNLTSLEVTYARQAFLKNIQREV